MPRKKYSDEPVVLLKEKSPIFLFTYNLSVFVVYIGTILFGWYFVNLAYTVGIPTYDILCLECKYIYHILMMMLMTFWLFCFYFYILNEVRFRFWNYVRKTLHLKIKTSNFYLLIATSILTFLTFLSFIK